jgi:hypothetical protein
MNIKVEKIKLKASDENFKYRIKFQKIGKYKINEDVVDITSYNQTLTLDNIEDIQFITTSTSIDCFVSKKDDSIISHEEYQKKKYNLLKKHNEDTQQWEDLESEFEYKKYINDCIPKYKENEPTYTKVEVKIDTFFILDTEDKYITSDFFLGKSSPICSFTINQFARDTFYRICKEIGLEEKKGKGKTFHISENSGLRFAQISDSYIFNERWDFKGAFKADFEKCLERKLEVENEIKNIVLKEFNVRFNKSQIEKPELLKNLKYILGSVQKLDTKIKSNQDKQSVIRKLNLLIEEIYES